jgi:hypothetical protein
VPQFSLEIGPQQKAAFRPVMQAPSGIAVTAFGHLYPKDSSEKGAGLLPRVNNWR